MQPTTRIRPLQQKIRQLRTKLQTLGDLRPGSLSQQYTVCGKPGCRCQDPQHPQRHGPYYKLSYVHRGRFTSQFIKNHQVRQVRAELATYKKLRRLTSAWIDLALQVAKLKLKLAL